MEVSALALAIDACRLASVKPTHLNPYEVVS